MLIASKLTDVIHQHPDVTDIRVIPGSPVMVGSPSGYAAFDDEIVTPLDIDLFAASPTVVGQGWKYRVFSRGGRLSGAVDLTNSRVRFSLFATNAARQEFGLRLRIIRGAPIALDKLGAPPVFRELVEMQTGLTLITGPEGAGKTTTLAALVDHINQTSPCRITTIEEPIEYLHKSACAFVTQREIGPSTRSFRDVAFITVREDPDVIATSDIPDRETADALLAASDAGRSVFAIVPASDAAGAVDRLLGLYQPAARRAAGERLGRHLNGIIAQTLNRAADGATWVMRPQVTLRGDLPTLVRRVLDTQCADT